MVVFMVHLKDRLYLPQFLSKHIDSDEISALISTRWREHLVERYDMNKGAGMSQWHPAAEAQQQQLIKLRLQRARLEVCLYEKALSSAESESACDRASSHTWAVKSCSYHNRSLFMEGY
jgi:hypothetical protein